MSTERSLRTVSKSKKIPLHYQKRYLANKSNGSFNASHMAGIGVYKNKVKQLLMNNKILAVELENEKTKKEELMEENKRNANIITFARLKLATLSDGLKTVVSVLDEALSLLQLHSSASSSKFTLKHTVCRDEFKDKVKRVLMDPISEVASPKETANQIHNENTNSGQCDQHQEETSPEIKVDLFDKNHQTPEKPKKGRKYVKRNKSKEEPPEQYVNNLHYGAKCEDLVPITSVNSYKENIPEKLVKNNIKKLTNRNKNLKCKGGNKKVPTNKKMNNANKNGIGNNKKRVTTSSNNSNDKENNTPTKSEFYESKLCNDIDVEKPETCISAMQNIDEACTLKRSVSPIKLFHDNVSDTYVISDADKENRNSSKQRTLSKKLKSLDEDELLTSITTKRTFERSSALKSLSSRMNIENCDKGKTNQLDVLITTKQKSAGIMLATNSPEICDESKSYLQDLTLHQQQMVKNLAENTFLVTAEVHKNVEPLKANKKQAESLSPKQPVVLVGDFFESGKTFCKSISSQGGDELSRIPLELELLKHCSSLKVIPEESIHSEDSSIGKNFEMHDQPQHKPEKTKKKNIELPLSFEEEKVKDEPMQEKRAFRKRSASLNYKVPNLNVKMRR